MPGAGFSDANRRVVRSQVVIAATEAIRFALLLFLTATLGRELLPADFGFVTLVPAIYLVAHVLLDLGTGALISRESARRPERERPLLEASLFVRGLLGAAIGLVVAALAFVEKDPSRKLWLFVTALSLPALAPVVLGSAFRVRQDQVAPALISLGTIVVMIALTLVCVRRHAAGPTFASIYVLREVVNGLGLWILARARHGLLLRPGLSGRDAGRFFRAAIPQNIAVVFQIASLNAGVFAIRALLGEEQLGAYSAAWRLVNPLLLLMGALVAPLLPVLAQGAGDRKRFLRIVAPALGLSAGIGVLGVAFLLAAGRDALKVLYESHESVKFSGGPLDAHPALLWLGFVFAAVCVGSVGTTALLCLDGERQLRVLAIMALALNMLVFAISLPWLGRVAAAAGLLAAEGWTAIAAMRLVHRKAGPLGVVPILRGCAPALAAAVLILLVPAGSPLFRVALAGGLAALAIVAMMLFGAGRTLRSALHEGVV